MAGPEPRRGFQTPREVLEYFRGKRLQPAFSWQDVWGEEHACAFMVSKATELELVTLFQRSIDTAITKGQGLETWSKALIPELARLGWAGPRLVEDPTGQLPARVVDFTSPRRLATIFHSNVASAHSAGEWQQAQRTKADLPYILYEHTTAKDPRPEHLGWVGIILHVDDPWWKTHWPPNGWGCKCMVSQITAREAERLLGRPPGDGGPVYRSTPPDDGPPRTFINKRTGEVTEVPAGIDPGWATNPGLSRVRTLVNRLSEQLAAAGENDARAAIAELWKTSLPRVVAGLPQRERVDVPVAISPQLAEAMGAEARLITVSRDTLAEKLGSHRDRPTALETFARAQELIDDGRVLDRGQPNRRTVVTEREEGWWATTIAMSREGFMRVVSITRRDTDRVLRWLRDDDAAGGT